MAVTTKNRFKDLKIRGKHFLFSVERNITRRAKNIK